MNYTLAIPNSLRKTAALLAIVSLLATSLPIGALTAFAANTDAVGTVTVDLMPNSSSTSTKEYFTISFSGTGTLNLDGWTVEDSNPITYSFGAVSLNNGDSLKVCSGPGDTADCDVEWTGSPVWNDAGDTLSLLDEGSATILSISYSPSVEDQVYSDNAAVDYAPPACTPQFDVPGPTNIQNISSGDYFDTISDALADCDTNDGDSIDLLGDISISEQATINRPIILDGNGYAIDAAFAKTTNSNNSAIGVQSNDVTIQNVTVDGVNGTDLHGINVYTSTGVSISSVTAQNFRTGLLINGSTVNVSDITTSGNTWHAINVDQGSGVTEPAVLNISNTSSHAETSPTPNPHIFIDDISAGVTVNDTDGQYDSVEFAFESGTARAYTLKTPSTPIPLCSESDSVSNTTFDTFSNGDVNGQNDWDSTGPYDQEVVDNTYGYSSFGCKSLRISNEVTTGSFGDQTFAAPLTDSVGEVDATAGGFPEGTRYNRYEVEFDIASTKPDEQQSGLALSVSPDRGDGSRMSYLSFADAAGGIDVTFYDVQGTDSPANFTPTSLVTLDRSIPHTIKFVMEMNDGPSNDVVEIYIDGALEHTGTSWENYFRFDTEASAEQSPRLMKTLLFRSAGTAVPANAGNGFLFDNISLVASDTVVTPSEISSPATDGDVVSGTTTLAAFYSDENDDNNDGVQWAVRSGVCSGGINTVLGNVDGHSDPFNWDSVNFTTSFDTTSVANGNYCFVFNPTEDSGGVDQRLTRLFTVDNGPEVPETPSIPTAIFTATPSGTVVSSGGYTQEQNFTFDLSSAPDVNRYQLKYWNDIVGSVFKEPTPWNPTNLAPYSSSLGVYNDNFTQGEGTHYFAFSACNSSDDCSDYSESFVVTYDATAPTAPQITHPVAEQVFETTPILNEWTVATDNDGIDYYQIAYRYDDAHTFGGTTCPDVTIDGDWVGCRDVDGTSRNHSPALSEQGGVTIWVRAFDNAGNVSDWSDPVHYYYDVDGSGPMDNTPAVPTGLGWNDSNSDPVADGGTTELVSGTAVWTANTEPDFSYYIYKYWNNISTSAFNSTSTAYVVNNGAANSRSGSFNQGEGTHYFCIVAVDNGGHESECSDEFTIIYDTNSPEPTHGSSTQTVSGNTAVAENQPGWLFNRDTGTQSPFAFVLGTSTIGTGSLFINPITNTINGNNDKFIAELFLLSPIAQLDSLSYDFNIAAVDATDENEFYMSVYANFGSSSSTNYYDCRYSVVPTVGVVNGWTTVTFNPASTYPVAKWGGSTSIYACPTSPDAMDTLDAGSKIRAIALNVGDTSANDLGVSGYFDNVVVVQTTGLHTETTIYDFEPTTSTTTTETETDSNGGGGGGGGGGGSNNDDDPTPTVLGASTDSELYDLLEEIKKRLTEFLLASYVSAESPSGQSSSGAVLGDSIAQADAQLPETEEDEENVDEDEDTGATQEEDEESEEAMTIPWQNYYWLLVLLWLLSSAGALWRRNEFPETLVMRTIQGTFIAVALLLLAGAVFFGLVGAFWPSLIVTIGAITAYFWSLE